MTLSRREFLVTSALATAGVVVTAAHGQAPPARTRLILLGTAGGPRPKKNHSAPSQVVVVDGSLYVVDCGDGVARQIALAGLPLDRLRHVFVTHHHSDHNAGYGNLLLLAWASGLRTRVDSWGPPPLRRMTKLFFELNATDIDIRIHDEGRVPLSPLIHAHDIKRAGLVMQDDKVKVTCAVVEHPPITPSFAYRFDTPDRSIVFSGDTRRSEALIRLARGADVLVHEAMYMPAVDRLVARIPNASTLRKHLIESHTTPEECGRIATEAGVKMLVLSHLVPPDDPLVSDEDWIAAARQHFDGEIRVGRDLAEL
jgi:ribonuclease BN (tRNA processing enzyme)